MVILLWQQRGEGWQEVLKEMDYEAMSNEALYRLFKIAVPETLIDKVDDSNRNTVIAILKIAETNGNGRTEGSAGNTQFGDYPKSHSPKAHGS